MNKVRIGIIGAGQGGFALLQSLQDIPQVDVVGICDVDDTSPALVEAANLGISTFPEADALIRAVSIDWLINFAHISITQRHIISRDLKEVVVIDGQIADLIWRLLIDFDNFYNQVQESRTHNLSPEEQVESIYNLSWTVIQQVVNIIQPVQHELEQIAFRDPLTGLYSRRILMEFLDREINRAYRQKKPLSVVIAAIDHFKAVNDQFGHDAGDRLIKVLSELLMQSVRSSDLAARYGGEEFVLVLPASGLAAATLWAERMCERARTALTAPDDSPITISLGVASLEAESSDATTTPVTARDLLNNADKALYKAKNSGRDQAATFTETQTA